LKLAVQIAAVLRRPLYALPGFAIAVVTSSLFLYLDEFYFVSPYFAVYIDPSRVPVFLLDIAISILSGIVVVASVYEIRTFAGSRGSYRKTGIAGIVAALVAGACPCYYLIPLLAILGGVGGALSAFGILLYSYEFPIKSGSLVLLVFTGFTLERGLRAACAIPVRVDSAGLR
jgi:hypothetical protein